jgi:site-specific DNA-methyltransferase (adenine-specific)
MDTNIVYTGDCITILNRLPAASAELVFADPPFNIGYQYDVYDDRRAKADYLGWAEKWLSAATRVLKPTGAFFLAIGDEFAAEHKVLLDKLGLTLRNWIIWHYTFGVNCTKKFNRSHAHIFYFVRDPKRYTFNADEIRVPSARMTTYADRRANPVGKLPDDTWVLRPQESESHFRGDQDTWFVSRVCGTFKERVRHPCQMPEGVLERIIRVASNPGLPAAGQRWRLPSGWAAVSSGANCPRSMPKGCASGSRESSVLRGARPCGVVRPQRESVS